MVTNGSVELCHESRPKNEDTKMDSPHKMWSVSLSCLANTEVRTNKQEKGFQYLLVSGRFLIAVEDRSHNIDNEVYQGMDC